MPSSDITILRTSIQGANRPQEAWDKAQGAASALDVVLHHDQGLEGRRKTHETSLMPGMEHRPGSRGRSRAGSGNQGLWQVMPVAKAGLTLAEVEWMDSHEAPAGPPQQTHQPEMCGLRSGARSFAFALSVSWDDLDTEPLQADSMSL